MTFYQCLKFKKIINPKLVGIILGVLITGTIFLVSQEFLSFQKEINNLNQIETNEKITKQIVQEKVLCTIDFGDGNVKSYQTTFSENSTIFSLLEALSKEESLQLEWKIYEGMGVFVESIDGVKNGTDNKYWQYWVNDKSPSVSADNYTVKMGDKIEWKFIPSPF